MKKVLEGELLSLAHRVLQLKDKEVDNLFKEAKELYEKLLILKFYQDHLDEGRISNVSPEQLDNALKAMAINNLNTSIPEENVRHQMPIDLVEEDYPIIVEAEKDAINTIDESLLADKVNKITPEVEDVVSTIPQRVVYDEPFITEVYIDESADEADDAQLHQYLDQHEAMLKQAEEIKTVPFNELEAEELVDEIEVSTFYGDEPVEEDNEEDNEVVNEEIVSPIEEPSYNMVPGVEEHSVISVEEPVSVDEVIAAPMSIDEPLVPIQHELTSTPVIHSLEEEKGESIEQTLVNINQQFATAHIDEPLIETPKIEEQIQSITEERTPMQGNTVATSSDDPFFGFDFSDVEFVRVDDVDKSVINKFDNDFIAVEPKVEPVQEPVKPIQEPEYVETPKAEDSQSQNTLFNVESTPVREPKINKNKSINDIYNTTIVVGLNDRIAFERHLFNGSAEDFNRVLSQLNTVSSFDEANSLIDHLIRPEYNNWEGKDEYAERFMALVEKRFI